MPTWNKELHSLTRDDVDRISLRYLMGYHNFSADGYSFRLRGFNSIRKKYGLCALTRDLSDDYRVEYIQQHYTYNEIYDVIFDYLSLARVGDTRWDGIELFCCRFGREYAQLFRRLLGDNVYAILSEQLRKEKSISKQIELYGGVGLAGNCAKQKAIQTNMEKHGSYNVMHDDFVRAKLASTNIAKYGGISPFSSPDVRQKAVISKNENRACMMRNFANKYHIDVSICESTFEFAVLCSLINRFGKDDVVYQYGVSPYDVRYPYNCDFYVKSMDLFIEINAFFTHGGHWFDANDDDDVGRLNHLMLSDSEFNHVAAKIWSEIDVEKRNTAKESNLNYLVFWDGRVPNEDMNICPFDFNVWFVDYDCDYDRFIKDHPENTY